jgi:hypothetical protein
MYLQVAAVPRVEREGLGLAHVAAAEAQRGGAAGRRRAAQGIRRLRAWHQSGRQRRGRPLSCTLIGQTGKARDSNA